MATHEELANRHGFHRGTAETIPLHEQVRTLSLSYAEALNEIIPASREASLALTAVQEASMWANAAIATHMAPLE